MKKVEVRASSWADLFDCAYRWEGVHRFGMNKPISPRMHLGTAIHETTALADLAHMNLDDYTPSDVADIFMHNFHYPKYEVDWTYTDAPMISLEHTGVKLAVDYHNIVTPLYEFDAVEKQIDDVEIEVPKHGITIVMTGKMDRSRIITSDPGGSYPWPIAKRNKRIVDLKTGKQAVENGRAKTKGNIAQVAAYQLIEQVASGEAVDSTAEIIGMKTAGTTEIGFAEIPKAMDIMTGTEDTPGMIEIAANMFKEELFPPNPFSLFCDKRYCPRWEKCLYHG